MIVGRYPRELAPMAAVARRLLVPVVAIGSVYNLLLLSGSFFMLLVYDDVLPSHSIPSLASLLLLVTIAYGFQAALDIVRGRISVHLGTLFTQMLGERVLDVLSRFELTRGTLPNGPQVVRDVDTVRAYLAGPGPMALLDLPWILVYLGILAIFHWSLGLLALAGVLVLVALMVANGRMTAPLAQDAMRAGARRAALAEATLRQAEAIAALGMAPARAREWQAAETDFLAANDRLSGISSTLSGVTKAFRLFLQSATLALGAWLVIRGSASGGIIIASSILSSRALAPVEQVIGQWKAMVSSRQALSRIADLFDAVPMRIAPMGLDLPSRSVTVQGLAGAPPGARTVTMADVGFTLEAGNALAVIGRSGSGKTTLARLLCGIWPALRGTVRFDGATLDQWPAGGVARIIGYLPQSIELFEGTVAQNIARFEPDADRAAIIAAAKAADCHDLIIRLPGGYDAMIGPHGGGLSAGQQQRVALARALYRDPFLVVLDEPNSNLDYEGERALGLAIGKVRERAGIVIVIAHRPSVVAHVSHVLVMSRGRIERFETREEFEARIGAPASLPVRGRDRPGSPAQAGAGGGRS